jgi:Protein of unknown function (DUF2959)
MNRNWYRSVVVSAFVLIGLLAAAAPVAAQSKASTKSVDSLNAVLKELQKARGQVQSAMDSLGALSSGGDANLKKNYDNYTKQVSGLNKTKETASARAEDLKQRREAYLAEWQKKSQEVSDPAIQAHMQARAEEVKKVFEGMQPAAQVIRETFPPFLVKLNDIQKLLSVDLSAAGVASAAPIGQQAVQDGTTITQSLDTMITTLTGIRDQVAPPKK